MLILEFLIIMINLHLTLSDRMDIRQQCRDYRPQRNVNIDEIKGQWKVVEVITHNETDFHKTYLMSNINQISILPANQTSPRHKHDDLRIMLWDENNISNHIRGRISDINSGYWMAYISERDDRLNDYDIEYNAVIQILKKTDRYMLLNFCTNPLFSVYMVRNYYAPPPEETTKEVHNILQYKGLELRSIKEYSFIRNSANMVAFASYFHIFSIVMCRFFK